MRRSSTGWLLALLLTSPGWCAGYDPLVPAPTIRIERTNVVGGGELVTFISRLPDRHDGGEVPLVSILRDTLGDNDPANDRIRKVWAFGYKRPTLSQRFWAGVPFLYWRTGVDRRSHAAPAPVLDLAHTARGTFPKLAEAALQSTVLDPMGMRFRASSRAYRSRTSEYRSMYVFRALEVLGSTTPTAQRPLPAASNEGPSPRTWPPEASPSCANCFEAGGLNTDELNLVQGRLILSNTLLGGLVSQQAAPSAWLHRRENSSVNRGRNWELLRQRAEDNGLYFEPLRIGSEDVNFAVLWVDADRPGVTFDGKFLGISDPRNDTRIRNWRGYTETWHFDPNGQRLSGPEPGSRAARMVPLALYALDHPKVPLLIVDFRDPGKMKRHEMAFRFTDEVATGVLGFTGWGNWPYMAAKTGWFFVRGRHGAPVDRSARVNAYVQLRQGLLMDRALPADLRDELAHRVERLGWNPYDAGVAREIRFAQSQYQSLLVQADGRLGRDLDRERLSEIKSQVHSGLARTGLRLAAVASFGLYRHHDVMTPERLEAVDQQRRSAFVERVQAIEASLPRTTPAISSGAGQ